MDSKTKQKGTRSYFEGKKIITSIASLSPRSAFVLKFLPFVFSVLVIIAQLGAAQKETKETFCHSSFVKAGPILSLNKWPLKQRHNDGTYGSLLHLSSTSRTRSSSPLIHLSPPYVPLHPPCTSTARRRYPSQRRKRCSGRNNHDSGRFWSSTRTRSGQSCSSRCSTLTRPMTLM